MADIPIPETTSTSNQSYHDTADSGDNDDDDNEGSQEFSSDSESDVGSMDPPNISGALIDGKEDSSKAPAPVLSPKAVAEPLRVEGLAGSGDKVCSGTSGSYDGSSPGSSECSKKTCFDQFCVWYTPSKYFGQYASFLKFHSSYMFCLESPKQLRK